LSVFLDDDPEMGPKYLGSRL